MVVNIANAICVCVNNFDWMTKFGSVNHAHGLFFCWKICNQLNASSICKSLSLQINFPMPENFRGWNSYFSSLKPEYRYSVVENVFLAFCIYYSTYIFCVILRKVKSLTAVKFFRNSERSSSTTDEDLIGEWILLFFFFFFLFCWVCVCIYFFGNVYKGNMNLRRKK